MKFFKIVQPATGVILGVFEALTESDAIDEMAMDAGYADAREMDSVSGGNSDSLDVTDVTGLHYVQTDYNRADASVIVWVNVNGERFGVYGRNDGSVNYLDSDGVPLNDVHPRLEKELYDFAVLNVGRWYSQA